MVSSMVVGLVPHSCMGSVGIYPSSPPPPKKKVSESVSKAFLRLFKGFSEVAYL